MRGVEESVSATIATLGEALCRSKREDDDGTNTAAQHPSIFLDESVLARPPFAYVHALATFLFVENRPPSVCAELLSLQVSERRDSDLLWRQHSLSKKEKLTFLSRLLALVSRLTGRRYDILVSPSKILSGKDVLATHQFLRALASVASAPTEEITAALKIVSDEGDADIYKRGVRTRRAITILQAKFRGGRARKCFRSKHSSSMNDGSGTSGRANSRQGKSSKGISTTKSEEDVMLESYQAVLSRKSEVEDELKAAEAKLKKENDKLIRILNLGTMHKTRTHVVPYAGMPRPPPSAPSLGTYETKSKVTKGESHTIDQTFSEKITNLSERQRSMKQKERQMEERETRLKQRFVRSKHKETRLKLQEERISDLAAKMRNQQMQLKDQRLQLERSRALEPEAPPETSKPCPLCTEKRIQMRDIRSKVRQRTRHLNQREALVIQRAQELRRRETHVARRERFLVEMENQHSDVDDLLSEYTYDEALRTPQRHDRRRNEENDSSVKSLSDVREHSKVSSQKKGGKKRRRRGPREISISNDTPQENESALSDREMVDERQDSIRASFSECIPTIEEETAVDEQDGWSITEEASQMEDVDPAKSEAERAVDDALGERQGSVISDENIVPHNINSVRRSLGIVKKTAKNEVPRTSSVRRGSQMADVDLAENEAERAVDDALGERQVSDENVVPHDVNSVRRSLGIMKKTAKYEVPRRSSVRRQREETANPAAEWKVSQAPPPKQRHIFTFEKKGPRGAAGARDLRGQKSLALASGDERGSQQAPARIQSSCEGGGRVPHGNEKHDDWVSSFDVQMKCAMNRLKELV